MQDIRKKCDQKKNKNFSFGILHPRNALAGFYLESASDSPKPNENVFCFDRSDLQLRKPQFFNVVTLRLVTFNLQIDECHITWSRSGLSSSMLLRGIMLPFSYCGRMDGQGLCELAYLVLISF
ncbi:hypothetical protein Sjap_014368 [Stephania japonica]|uniref:Uncharacterized protein n=1 Tax=Stephania japonica TaxID=461633 RepID=A0AAP0P272_9MAGN